MFSLFHLLFNELCQIKSSFGVSIAESNNSEIGLNQPHDLIWKLFGQGSCKSNVNNLPFVHRSIEMLLVNLQNHSN